RGEKVRSVQVKLFGSLSKTGIGHGTDMAVMLGLSGFDPESIHTSAIPSYIREIAAQRKLNFGGEYLIDFDPKDCIQFLRKFLPQHPNAIRFITHFAGKKE